LTLFVGRQEGHPACKVFSSASQVTTLWRYTNLFIIIIIIIKNRVVGCGVVVCLERDADLHTGMALLMPLPLTVSCSRLVLPFWYRLIRVIPEKGPLNGCVCVCQTAVVRKSKTKRRAGLIYIK